MAKRLRPRAGKPHGLLSSGPSFAQCDKNTRRYHPRSSNSCATMDQNSSPAPKRLRNRRCEAPKGFAILRHPIVYDRERVEGAGHGLCCKRGGIRRGLGSDLIRSGQADDEIDRIASNLIPDRRQRLSAARHAMEAKRAANATGKLNRAEHPDGSCRPLRGRGLRIARPSKPSVDDFTDTLIGRCHSSPPPVNFRSVALARDGGAAAAAQEVEVGALVGLQHVRRRRASDSRRSWPAPARLQAARRRRELGVADLEVQAPGLDVELDHVAVLAPARAGRRPRPRGRRAGPRCRRRCRSCARPRCAPCRCTPLRSTFGGRPMLPTSAMPGIALRAAVLEHQDAGLVDVERLVVDLGLVVLDGLEHHGAAAMLHQGWRRGRGLEHRAVGREVAAQHRDAAMPGVAGCRSGGSPRCSSSARP